MGRHGGVFGSQWKGIDAFGKEPSIVVDRSRGEKLVVNMNISFPRIPCYCEPRSSRALICSDPRDKNLVLSVDIMDISGEHQNDINHDILKTRLTPGGVAIPAPKGKDLVGDLERIQTQKAAGYCGGCYGGSPPTEGPNVGCCNSCEDVREAYVRRGWSFVNPDSVEQCVSEGWSDKIKEQSDEGCNIAGRVRVNKVIGNFHLSPGRSFQANSMHVHDLVPYLQGGNKHGFGHVMHKFAFESETEEEFAQGSGKGIEATKSDLGIVNPLDGIESHTKEPNYMFQYFVKVVSTQFSFVDGRELKTHQYSVTQYERDLTGKPTGIEAQGHQTSHGYAGVPGVFFNYEISPLMVIHKEERQSFAHFLTSTCAIIGGVLTIASLIDSFVYAGRNRLKKGGVKEGMGFARASGKFL